MNRGRRQWTAAFVGAALAVIVATIGIRNASFVAGASDAFGYVSEADLIAHGHLRIDQQFVRTLPWPFADWSFAPAGYRPALERGFIVPTYPPGVPLVMALFERVAGRTAVFYVVPLLGGLCIWVLSISGRSIRDDGTGIVVAVLMATSPIFLVELMAPASDVAATCWWSVALVGALRLTTVSAVTSGLAASMAVLTRPNLVFLDAVIASFLAGRALLDRERRRQAVVRLAAFSVAAAVG
jgi:4-amino-4-deoxy-L-arabinose transferase-like glycosyltransferase